MSFVLRQVNGFTRDDVAGIQAATAWLVPVKAARTAKVATAAAKKKVGAAGSFA
jgi:hypothetical protein